MSDKHLKYKENFANRLNKALAEAHMGQAELARALTTELRKEEIFNNSEEISTSTLNHYFKKGGYPEIPVFAKIAQILSKTIDFLLTGKDYSNLTAEERMLIELWRNKKYRNIRKMILEAEEKQEEAAHASEKTLSKKRRAGL